MLPLFLSSEDGLAPKRLPLTSRVEEQGDATIIISSNEIIIDFWEGVQDTLRKVKKYQKAHDKVISFGEDTGVREIKMHSQVRTQGILSGKTSAADAKKHGKSENQAKIDKILTNNSIGIFVNFQEMNFLECMFFREHL